MRTIRVITIALLFVTAVTADLYGQCRDCSIQIANASGATGEWSTVVTDLRAGQYVVFSVEAGVTYEWSTCGSSEPLFDSDMTLLTGFASYTCTGSPLPQINGTIAAYNDDDPLCDDGMSTITWTAPLDGTVAVLVTQKPCTTNDVPLSHVDLRWRTICRTCSNEAPPGVLKSGATTNWSTAATQLKGGEYVRFAVTEGTTYTWSTCQSNTPAFDTELTLLKDPSGSYVCGGVPKTINGQVIAYNDDGDGCSDGMSSITWQADFTGIVALLVTEKSASAACRTNTSSPSHVKLDWRTEGCRTCANPLPATPFDNPTPQWTTVATNITGGGTPFLFHVLPGTQYEWRTTTTEPFMAFDTEITVIRDLSSTYICTSNQINGWMVAYNDNDANLTTGQSRVSWFSDFNGTVAVIVTKKGCAVDSSPDSNISLEWRTLPIVSIPCARCVASGPAAEVTTPATESFTEVATDLRGGEYVTFPIEMSTYYEWTTCNSPDPQYGTTLTLLFRLDGTYTCLGGALSGTPVAANNDGEYSPPELACEHGMSTMGYWFPPKLFDDGDPNTLDPTTGRAAVLVNQSVCETTDVFPSGSGVSLRWRKTTPPSHCENCSRQYPPNIQTTPGEKPAWRPLYNSVGNQVVEALSGGDYVLFAVEEGYLYEWTTCQDTQEPWWDTQLTLHKGTCGGELLAYNNNAIDVSVCPSGVLSTLTWYASFTGTVSLLLSEYFCQSNIERNMTIKWRRSGGTTPCTECGDGSAGTVPLNIPLGSSVSRQVSDGQYLLLTSLEGGATYEFSTCATGGTYFDTQLTLRGEKGVAPTCTSPLLAYNDNGEGTGSISVTATPPSTFTAPSHGLLNGMSGRFTGNPLPTGISADTDYYVVNADANTFQVALAPGGIPVSFSNSGNFVTFEVPCGSKAKITWTAPSDFTGESAVLILNAYNCRKDDFGGGKQSVVKITKIKNTRFTEIDYKQPGERVVNDNTTNLFWHPYQIVEGKTWQEALTYCDSLVYGGYDDWRLPTINDLISIADFNLKNPATAMPSLTIPNNEKKHWFWSSTTYIYGSSEGVPASYRFAWVANLMDGRTYSEAKAPFVHGGNPVSPVNQPLTMCVRDASTIGVHNEFTKGGADNPYLFNDDVLVTGWACDKSYWNDLSNRGKPLPFLTGYIELWTRSDDSKGTRTIWTSPEFTINQSTTDPAAPNNCGTAPAGSGYGFSYNLKTHMNTIYMALFRDLLNNGKRPVLPLRAIVYVKPLAYPSEPPVQLWRTNKQIYLFGDYQLCGDGYQREILSGEECDDANDYNTDACVTVIDTSFSGGGVAVTANPTNDTFTASGHQIPANTRGRFTGSPLPGGISSSTIYYTRDVTADTFKVSLTPGGPAVNITSAGNNVVFFPPNVCKDATCGDTYLWGGVENCDPPRSCSYYNPNYPNYYTTCAQPTDDSCSNDCQTVGDCLWPCCGDGTKHYCTTQCTINPSCTPSCTADPPAGNCSVSNEPCSCTVTHPNTSCNCSKTVQCNVTTSATCSASCGSLNASCTPSCTYQGVTYQAPSVSGSCTPPSCQVNVSNSCTASALRSCNATCNPPVGGQCTATCYINTTLSCDPPSKNGSCANPTSCSQTLYGKDRPEECDGAAGETCHSYNPSFYDGNVNFSCDLNCRVSAGGDPWQLCDYCGDGEVQDPYTKGGVPGYEQCDTANENSKLCHNLNRPNHTYYATGHSATCNASCLAPNADSECYWCGDNRYTAGFETCDPTATGSNTYGYATITCNKVSHVPPYYDNKSLTCVPNCAGYTHDGTPGGHSPAAWCDYCGDTRYTAGYEICDGTAPYPNNGGECSAYGNPDPLGKPFWPSGTPVGYFNIAPCVNCTSITTVGCDYCRDGEINGPETCEENQTIACSSLSSSYYSQDLNGNTLTTKCDVYSSNPSVYCQAWCESPSSLSYGCPTHCPSCGDGYFSGLTIEDCDTAKSGSTVGSRQIRCSTYSANYPTKSLDGIPAGTIFYDYPETLVNCKPGCRSGYTQNDPTGSGKCRYCGDGIRQYDPGVGATEECDYNEIGVDVYCIQANPNNYPLFTASCSSLCTVLGAENCPRCGDGKYTGSYPPPYENMRPEICDYTYNASSTTPGAAQITCSTWCAHDPSARMSQCYDDGTLVQCASSGEDACQKYTNTSACRGCGDGKNYIPDGLSLYYHFDEPDGIIIYDSSPSPIRGTFSTGVSRVTGYFNRAIAFTQSSNLSIPDANKLDITGPMTLMFWFKQSARYIPSPLGSDPRPPYPIIVKGHGWESNYGFWMDDDGTNNFMVFSFHPSQGSGCSITIPRPSENQWTEWTHVAIVFTGNQLIAYRGGAQVAGPVNCTVTPTANNYPITIGDDSPHPSHGQVTYSITGYLDEFMIYNRVLSQTEITNLRLNPQEFCDDGNTNDRDGCSRLCAVENNMVCEGSPSTCFNPEANLCSSLTFNYTGSITTWTVPLTGTYRIEAWGAQGGHGRNGTYTGGLGARMRGDFSLTAGTVLKILVGGQGGTGSYVGGGGGGTFVVNNADNSPYIVAGGGGGGGYTQSCSSLTSRKHAVTGTSGITGIDESYCNDAGAGGSGGGGGNYDSSYSAYVGGGGGGLNGNGSAYGSVNYAGKSLVNGGAGGAPYGSGTGAGGFGGGGGAGYSYSSYVGYYVAGGGGGGGYSGGGGGSGDQYYGNYWGAGGGGGSYNAGSNQSNSGGVRSGNGLVTIQRLACCGNGTVDSGEQCDLGANNGPCSSCSFTCTSQTPTCGDGVLCPGEECENNLPGRPANWATPGDTEAAVDDGCYSNCKMGFRPLGKLEGAQKTAITGYACDPDNWSGTVTVLLNFGYSDGAGGYIYHSSETTQANLASPPPVHYACGGEAANHNFSFNATAKIAQMESEGRPKPYIVWAYAYDPNVAPAGPPNWFEYKPLVNSGQLIDLGICGDGVVSGTEQCDDLNANEFEECPACCLNTCERGSRPKGWVDSYAMTGIAGWTCDSDDYNGTVEVWINFHDGNNVFRRQAGPIMASNWRGDLPGAGVCGGTGAHGYSYDSTADIAWMEAQGYTKPYRVYIYFRNNVGTITYQGHPTEWTLRGDNYVVYCGNTFKDGSELCDLTDPDPGDRQIACASIPWGTSGTAPCNSTCDGWVTAGNCQKTYTCSGLPSGAWWYNNSTSYSYTQTWNGSAWVPADDPTPTYNPSPAAGTCQYKCQTNYTWNGSACVPNNRTYVCSAKPEPGTIYNTVSQYTQTWNGSQWTPPDDPVTDYNATPSTTDCRYTCDAANGYVYDAALPGPNKCRKCGNGIIEGSEQCEHGQTDACSNRVAGATHGTVTCDTTTCQWITTSCQKYWICTAPVPAQGAVFNTAAGYWQTWNGSAWVPADDATTEYNTTPSTTECRYTCDAGYTYDNTMPPANQCRKCGDAVTQGIEECDDGNSYDKDGCKNDCTLNTCGDGIARSDTASENVLYLPLDENNGTTLFDYSGYGHTGSASNTTWTGGIFGSALSFNGTSSVATVPTATPLRLSKEMTVAFWMKTGTNPTDWVRLVGKGAWNTRNYGMWLATNGTLLFQILASDGVSWGNAQTAVTVTDNNWHHVVGTYNGNMMRIYVDNVERASAAWTYNPITSTDPVTIGYGNMHTYYTGVIDNVRIFNRALLPVEVVNSVLWLSFDALNGNIAYDISGKGNNGTISGATTTTGRFGNALSCDGVDDYIQWNYTAYAPRPTNTFTVEAWVKPTTTHEIDPENTTGTGGVSGQRYLFWPDHQGTNAGMGISVGTNGVSVYEHGDGYMPALAVWQGTLSTTAWTHVVVTYTAKQPRIYINGSLVRTGLTSPRPTVFAPTRAGGGAYGYFPGGIDEIKIYNVALTAEEIRKHYQYCDDGNKSNTDDCTNACTLAICGDGYVKSTAPAETCDSNTIACSSIGYGTSGNAPCNSTCSGWDPTNVCQKTWSCSGLPANAVWANNSTTYSYTQTWNGSAWSPPDSSASYNFYPALNT